MRRLHDLWRRGRRMARDAATDAELLGRFTQGGDESAFAELVDRLGPLVYGVCRRLLANPADAEDAFQAAFLVLVRRADVLAGRPVGPWLHRVAVLTARRFRRARPTPSPPNEQIPPATAAVDARLDVDAALAALPEKYRVPVILCHLQGWTRRELAAHLGCPESTASSLVGRGLAKLRKRLAGYDAAALAVAGAAVVPSGLARATIRAAVVFRTNSLSAAISPAVAKLTEGVLRMFRVKQWAAGLVAAVVVTAGIGLGLAGGFAPRAEAQPAAPQDDPKAQREKLETEIAAAKDRLKQLEARKVLLDQHERIRNAERMVAKKAPVEPHIGLWVRKPAGAGQMLGRRLGLNREQGLDTPAMFDALVLGADSGWRSEFAINEFTRERPVVEAHFYDLASLKVYLSRAAKDPAVPKKLKLHIDKEYPWAKVKPLLDACREAGFTALEMAAVGGEPSGPAKSPYVIESPDVLRLVAVVRGQDEAAPLNAASLADANGDFPVRLDGTISLGSFGSVKVAGLTTDRVKDAVRGRLVSAFTSDGRHARPDAFDVFVAVAAANSKRYHIVTTDPEGRESVHTFPVTGSETIVDAIEKVEGLAARAAAGKIWIARPPAKDGDPAQTLQVDWAGITRQGVTRTNYQILPGDRVYVTYAHGESRRVNATRVNTRRARVNQPRRTRAATA